ncbi:hypothetical protein N9L92_02520, partial [Saprospiraceae bacterium]|nr:hypothetical protein [Saprospiraceae bacterium]
MYKHLLLYAFLLSFFTLQSQSQIVHKDFGDGWVIPLNNNMAVDMDEDGQRDFFINRVDGELGFTGIFARGCFASPYYNAMTPFGTRAFKLFEEGELIQLEDSNMDDYIEDDASAYSTSGGFADGWVDHEDVYIGVALLNSSLLAKNAWIKVSIDTDARELTIKEWAYTTGYTIGEGGILAGDTGALTSTSELVDIQEVLISPNPVSEHMNIKYDYSGQEELSIGV